MAPCPHCCNLCKYHHLKHFLFFCKTDHSWEQDNALKLCNHLYCLVCISAWDSLISLHEVTISILDFLVISSTPLYVFIASTFNHAHCVFFIALPCLCDLARMLYYTYRPSCLCEGSGYNYHIPQALCLLLCWLERKVVSLVIWCTVNRRRPHLTPAVGRDLKRRTSQLKTHSSEA